MIETVLLLAESATQAAQTTPAGEAPIGTIIQAVIASVLMVAGAVFVLAGTLGVLRLPDFYTRLHAAGMTDTLGAELILLGLIVQAGFSQVSLKLALVGFFLLITSPTATHAIAHAAWAAKLEPLTGKWRAPTIEEIEEKQGGRA
jgi:multicomponent Na+:H+ antiporter subunit G